MVRRSAIGILGVGAAVLCLASGLAYARDPNKVRCRASSADGATLTALYERERREFRADFQVDASVQRSLDPRVADPFEPGDVLNVRVNDTVVGRIVLDRSLSGKLEFDEQDKPFPANFPPFPPGTMTTVGTLSCIGQRR